LAILALLAQASVHAQTLPYSEDFTTTTYRDAAAGQTTADWSGTGQVLLPTAPALTGVTFDDTTAVEVLPGTYITRDVELADLDGDGDLDLIEGVQGPNGVYLNDGAGGFGAGRAYSSPVSSNTRGLAVGDVDRDGDIDFVSGNRSDRIRLYLNDGSGAGFTVQDVSDRGRKTQSVALADLNGDGLLDVIAANVGDGDPAVLLFESNYVYFNTGDPLMPFGAGGLTGVELDSAVKEESREVVTGDLDNDGDIDMVFLNESQANPTRQQRNRVYLNRLAQGFPERFTHFEIEPTGAVDVDNSHGGALGDLNGDGYLDLVVVNFSVTEQSKIYLNDGSGLANVNPFTVAATTFTVGGPNSDPTFAKTAILADSDNDGDLDIFMVIAGHAFRNRVYLNDGTGTITGFIDVGPVGQAPLVLGSPTDVGPVSLDGAVGDLDGDGDLDWVLGNQESQPATSVMANMVLRNTGNPVGGVASQQLRAHATSLTVDNVSGAISVRLNPAPATTSVGPAFHSSIDYWVTGNGGLEWTPISADGRPVMIAAGNDIRWKADLTSHSPVTAAAVALDQLDIEANTSGPVLGTPIGPRTVIEGQDLSGAPAITADFTDADGDTLYHALSGLPDDTGLGMDALSGQLTGTPSNADSDASPITVDVTATDGALAAMDTFTLTVTNTNDGPSFDTTPPDLNAGPPATSGATQDVLYTYNISASDPDAGDTAQLRFETLSKPAWLTLTDNNDGTAVLSGTPTAADVFSPDTLVELVVRDPAGAEDQQTFSMLIANVNDAPSIVSLPITDATEGTAYSYTITVEDADTDSVSITAPTLPAWLTITDNGDGTATLGGTPAGVDVGPHAVEILATEDAPAPGATDNQVFDITVTAAADGPVITVTGNASVSITEGTAYNDAGATATDVQDGDLTAQIAVDNPVNVNVVGTYTVTYTVTDSAGNMAQATRGVTVNAAPPPPKKKKKGGGSMGPVEMFIFALMTLAFGAVRRRSTRIRANQASLG